MQRPVPLPARRVVQKCRCSILYCACCSCWRKLAALQQHNPRQRYKHRHCATHLLKNVGKAVCICKELQLVVVTRRFLTQHAEHIVDNASHLHQVRMFSETSERNARLGIHEPAEAVLHLQLNERADAQLLRSLASEVPTAQRIAPPRLM